MSGIEVAGLLLGVIPLVISALEHYEGTLEPTIAFFKWNSELSAAVRKLWMQHTLYEQSIRLMLTPITNDQELNEMMDDTESGLWKDADLADQLRQRLGKAYNPYLSTIKEIEGIMKTLAEKLDIAGAAKVNQVGLEAIVLANPPKLKKPGPKNFEFQKRVKFTMRRQRVKKLLQELDDCNTRLDSFTEKAERLEDTYKADKKSKFALPLRLIQQNAARLYDVLSRSWCTTHPSHSASLLLESRLVRRTRGSVWYRRKGPEASSDVNCFGLSLLQMPSPRKWLDAEFRLIESIPCPQTSSARVVISAPKLSLPISPYGDISKLKEVTDLCLVLQQPTHHCVGFCLDDQGKLRGVYPAQKQAFSYVEDTTTLGDVLSGMPGTLSKEEIYNLSITLTSSLLQLSHTPWLNQSWNKSDIVFLRAKDGTSPTADVKHPYLTKTHTPDDTLLARNNTMLGTDCSRLLSLGIMLLEINYGQSIENLRRPEDLGPNHKPNELSNLQAAKRWMIEQNDKGNLSWAFSNAISHCLKCFVDPTASLHNPEFCKTIEEQVLAPLEDEKNVLLYGPMLH